jgi:S1-C subfamily serine protease
MCHCRVRIEPRVDAYSCTGEVSERPGSTQVRSRKPQSLADLVGRVANGVPRLEVNTCSGGDIGTGFLISSRLGATIEHVVHGAGAIRLKQGDRLVASGTVVGADPAQDLC